VAASVVNPGFSCVMLLLTSASAWPWSISPQALLATAMASGLF
jgi:hypothetical protein